MIDPEIQVHLMEGERDKARREEQQAQMTIQLLRLENDDLKVKLAHLQNSIDDFRCSLVS